MIFPERPRRNRQSAAVRSMVQETSLSVKQLVMPLFLLPGESIRNEVASMPGIFRFGEKAMLQQIEQAQQLGLDKFILFPAVENDKKNPLGTYSYSSKNFYLDYIRKIKARFPEAVVITDVALDPYSSDGHDGILKDGQILNDETIEVLVSMSLAQAAAGADILGPSDMMDGRVGAIRQALEENGFSHTAIMSYTAKYASAFYGPFRDALDSAPKSGNKKTYQMDPANAREALREAALDEAEGADYLMVKPALSYLDIIQTLRNFSTLPIVAYNVSGEYAMVKAAASKGWIDGEKVRDEMLLSMRRAGADIVITYFALEFAEAQNRLASQR
jgi:porphobilinogen synthase